MITVRLLKTKAGDIYGFSADSHGKGIVCAAVSILLQNTVNSVERLTDDHFICEYAESGGHLMFEHTNLKNGEAARDASLLLNSAALGLYGIQDEYGHEIKIITEVSHD